MPQPASKPKAAPKPASAPKSPAQDNEAKPRATGKDAPKPKSKTKAEMIVFLSQTIGDIIKEQEKMNEKLKNVQRLLDAIVNDDDDELNFDLNEEMDDEDIFEDDEPDTVEVDGESYTVGDLVELYDSKKKKWTKQKGVLLKFCEKQAWMTVQKKKTKRNYGNFRHFRYPDSESE